MVVVLVPINTSGFLSGPENKSGEKKKTNFDKLKNIVRNEIAQGQHNERVNIVSARKVLKKYKCWLSMGFLTVIGIVLGCLYLFTDLFDALDPKQMNY